MSKRLIGWIACSLLASAPALAQQDFSKVEVKALKLTDSTYMLSGAGGNIGLSVGDDAVFVIDSDFAPLAPKIKAAIARISAKPVQFVLNTHFHFDHSGGNDALGKDGALIVAHDNVRQRMSSTQLISFIGATQAASAKIALPVVTVPGDVKFHINGDEVHAFHVPRAHTDGDLVMYLPAQKAYCGEDLNGLYVHCENLIAIAVKGACEVATLRENARVQVERARPI